MIMKTTFLLSDSVDYFDMVDSDDEIYDLANPDHVDYF
jgi:hypothetical protein